MREARVRHIPGAQSYRRGPGHYSADGGWWWDETRSQWLRVVGVETLEIVADDSRDRSWATALVTVFVPYGDVYVRFVARERGPGLRVPRTFRVGDPFPAARAGLDDLRAQGAWLGIQQARLLELENALIEDGWRPSGRGQHWWSARYSRPRIDITTPPHAYERHASGLESVAGEGSVRRPRRLPAGRRPGLGARATRKS